MILLPRRTFIALCALTLGATAFLLVSVAAQYGLGPLARFTRSPARRASAAVASCPALEGQRPVGDRDQVAMDAYLSIEAALTRGSLAQVAENAARLAEAFGESNPAIAASARRLARVRDVTAARREFERLTGLFSRRPDEPDDEENDGDSEAAARSLEV